MNIKRKKNLPVAFGEVRQTTNTPTVITRLVKKANAPTAVAVRCVDQHEYSLMKILYVYYDDSEEQKEIYKGVGFFGDIFFLLSTLTISSELD